MSEQIFERREAAYRTAVQKYESRKMLATELQARRNDAQQLLRIRRHAYRNALRVRHCCEHCFNYQLVARVGGAIIIEGTLDDLEGSLCR